MSLKRKYKKQNLRKKNKNSDSTFMSSQPFSEQEVQKNKSTGNSEITVNKGPENTNFNIENTNLNNNINYKNNIDSNNISGLKNSASLNSSGFKRSPLEYLDAKESDSNIKKLILSGLLASLSFIIFSLTMVPIAQFIAIIIAPVPMTYISLKYGAKYGILCSLTASALVSMLLGPVQGYFFISLFAIVGLVTGIITRKKYTPMTILILGTIILIIFNLLFYYGVERMLGLQDFIAEAKTSVLQTFNWSAEKYVQFINPDPKEAEQIYNYTKDAVYQTYIWLKMPLFMFVIASFATFYLNYLVCSLFFHKMKIPGMEPLPPFFLWKAPKKLGILFILIFILSLLTTPKADFNDQLISWALINRAGPLSENINFKILLDEYAWKIFHPEPGIFFLIIINLKLCLDFAFYFLGLSLISFWLFTMNMSIIPRFFVMILSVPLFRIFTLIGLLDSFKDIRSNLFIKAKKQANKIKEQK